MYKYYNHFVYHRGKAQLIDGRIISKEIKDELKVEIQKWVAEGHKRPKLVAVLVGEDPASKRYVKSKMIAAEYVGKYILY